MVHLGECHPVHQNVAGSIPGQGTYLGCGFNSQSGCLWETINQCSSLTLMSLSLSPSLSLSLSASLSKLSKRILGWNTHKVDWRDEGPLFSFPGFCWPHRLQENHPVQPLTSTDPSSSVSSTARMAQALVFCLHVFLSDLPPAEVCWIAKRQYPLRKWRQELILRSRDCLLLHLARGHCKHRTLGHSLGFKNI